MKTEDLNVCVVVCEATAAVTKLVEDNSFITEDADQYDIKRWLSEGINDIEVTTGFDDFFKTCPIVRAVKIPISFIAGGAYIDTSKRAVIVRKNGVPVYKPINEKICNAICEEVSKLLCK